MKLFVQAKLLPVSAMTLVIAVGSVGVLAPNVGAAAPASNASTDAAVASGTHGGVVGSDGIERPLNPAVRVGGESEVSSASSRHFLDFPAIVPLSSPPAGACGNGHSIEGKSAWQRGYDQAMSGRRFKTSITTQSGTLHPELKECFEYSAQHLNASERSCCLAGFRRGYADLQRMVLNYLQHKEPAPVTAEAMACYHAFGEGRHAASEKCQELTGNALACRAPQINPSTRHLGCASMGYVAEIAQCPTVQAQHRALLRTLGGGALSGARMPANTEFTDGAAQMMSPPSAPAAGSATSTADPRLNPVSE